MLSGCETENSRQGVRPKNPAPHQGITWSNSTIALGIAGARALEGVGQSYRARYYWADTGRFVSEDPVRFASGNFSFYAYAENNPSNLVDPSGLQVVGQFPFGGSPGALATNRKCGECKGVHPIDLDYHTPRKYAYGWDTAAHHIYSRHIVPYAGKSLYKVGDPTMTPADILDYVEYELNAFTLIYGDQVRQGDRVVIQLTFPARPGVGWDGTSDPPYLIPPEIAIGINQSGNLTLTNTLILDKDCRHVITSYPGVP